MERGLNPIAPFGRQISLSLGWSGVGGKREAGLFFGDREFPTKPAQKPALLPVPPLRRRLSSREGFPTPKISLIREKTALMFWDIPGSKPVWLSGEFSELKITANSTCREVKRWLDGLGVAG